MADKKISQLSAATVPLSGTEVVPVVQSGSTVRVPVADLTAGRAVSVATLTVNGVAVPVNGVYAPASNQVGISVGSVEQVRVTANGVGIGTTSPGSKLDVLGAGRFGGDSSADVLFVRGRTSDNLGFLQFTNNGGGTVYSYIGTSAVNELAFYTNGFNQRMRIDPNGNIVAGASAALATTATNGFLYVPTCAGVPTGTPTSITGMAPIVVNTTNNKLYFYSGGAWRDAGP